MMKEEEREMMLEKVIGDMGYRLLKDKNGCLYVLFGRRPIYLFPDEDDDHYMVVLLPGVAQFGEGEEELALAVCNKMTHRLKMAKVYADTSMRDITATCEFYYDDETGLHLSMDRAFGILSIVQNVYLTTRQQMAS